MPERFGVAITAKRYDQVHPRKEEPFQICTLPNVRFRSSVGQLVVTWQSISIGEAWVRIPSKSAFFFSSFISAHQRGSLLHPLTRMGDQDRTSPYNINTISSRQVMRIKKNVNEGIIS